MKKILATLVLVFSLTGVYISADGREATRQQGVQVMSVFSGSLNSLALQRSRRRRIRWARNNNSDWNRSRWNRRRWNRGRTDNTWNRRRWNNRRGNDDWRGRGRRGRGRRGDRGDVN